MESKDMIQAIINQACGSVQFHKYSHIPVFPVITDGVLALAEAAECFWLLDVIGSHQINRKLDKAFQVWALECDKEGDGATVKGFNDDVLIVTQYIPYTDFPLDDLKLFLCDGVLMIPSEY